MRCYRDSLGVQVCHHAAKAQIVFVPVDGRKVFLVCLFLIVACSIWLALWLQQGVKFEEQ